MDIERSEHQQRPRASRRLRAAAASVALAVGGGAVAAATPASVGASATVPVGGDVGVYLYTEPLGIFNPISASVGTDFLLLQLQFDELVGIDGSNAFEPRLAESWEVSEDGRTWTFHLLDGLQWSDGEPFDANDVLFTYNLFANPESGTRWVPNFADVVGAADVADGSASTLSGLTAPDENTVVFELTEPNVAFVFNLNDLFILPEHVLADIPLVDLATEPFFREPSVGLGPFLWSEWASDDEIVFERNESYREPVHLDRIFAKVLSTDVATAQLETGDIDIVQVSPTDVERLGDSVTIHRHPGVVSFALYTAVDGGKLADPRLRQAVLYAIDRQALVDEVLAGEGRVTNSLYGPEWPPSGELEEYSYDPERARALFEEAGWDFSTELRLEVVPGQRDRDTTVALVAGQLQAIGVNAVVTNTDQAGLSAAIDARDFDLLISGAGNGSGTDPVAYDQSLLSGANLSGYSNPELDELLRRGVATTDIAERQAIYGDVQQIFNEDVPFIQLYVASVLWATSPRLQGFEPHSQFARYFWNVADWYVSD